MATADGVGTVPGWLAVILVAVPIGAWIALVAAGTVLVGVALLYWVIGAYLAVLGAAAAVLAWHRRRQHTAPAGKVARHS